MGRLARTFGWRGRALLALMRPNAIRSLVGELPRNLLSAEAALMRDGWSERLFGELGAVRGGLVVDAGGYTGESTSAFLSLGARRVIVFEPVPYFCGILRQRFVGDSRVEVKNFGIGGATTQRLFTLSGEGTGIFSKGGMTVEVQLVDAVEALEGIDDHIDVMMLNIEGAEFEVLERLLEMEESAESEPFWSSSTICVEIARYAEKRYDCASGTRTKNVGATHFYGSAGTEMYPRAK